MIEILGNKFSNAKSTYNDCSHFMTGIRAQNKNRFDNKNFSSGVPFVNPNVEVIKRFFLRIRAETVRLWVYHNCFIHILLLAVN